MVGLFYLIIYEEKSMPTSSDIQRLKLVLGDSDPSKPFYSDEQYQEFINMDSGNWRKAAITVANAISAKFSMAVDASTGSVSKSYSQLANNFRELARQLKKDLKKKHSGSVFVSGLCNPKSSDPYVYGESEQEVIKDDNCV